MLKTVGTMLICASILLFGSERILRLRRNAVCGRKMILLIRFIRAQIENFRMPLDEIFGKREVLFDVGDFDEALCEVGLYGALYRYGDQLFTDGELLELLLAFSGALGRSGNAEQLRHCDFYLQKLEERVASAETALPDQIKVYGACSFAAAATVLLLLL